MIPKKMALLQAAPRMRSIGCKEITILIFYREHQFFLCINQESSLYFSQFYIHKDRLKNQIVIFIGKKTILEQNHKKSLTPFFIFHFL